MFPDVTVVFNQGERRPIYVSVSDSVVLTVLTQPTVTAQPYYRLLLDGEELDSDAVTGFDGPDTTVRLWWNVDTAGLEPGRYTVEFTWEMSAAGEAFTRRYVRTVGMLVQ